MGSALSLGGCDRPSSAEQWGRSMLGSSSSVSPVHFEGFLQSAAEGASVAAIS